MIGRKFGRLTVLEDSGMRDGNGRVKYICECDCGSTAVVTGSYMRDGRSKSCGCLARELSRERATDHGMTKHRLYPTWHSMMSRCYNSASPAFRDYGARGISVCKRWHDVKKFVHDNDHLAIPGLSIDRIDNDGNYTPDNTRWATRCEQSHNRRSNVNITHQGETKTLFEWAREVGIAPRTLWARIRVRGWSVEKALETPVKKSSKNK